MTCGKPNCKRCSPPNGPILAHGPYWYLCITHKGRWVRIYLGKHLDTTRYRHDDGSIDWPAVHAARDKRRGHANPQTAP